MIYAAILERAVQAPAHLSDVEDDASMSASLGPSARLFMTSRRIAARLPTLGPCGGQEVGGFPGRTITEDYALGMELNKAGYGLRYLPAYLATGAAFVVH